MRVSVAEVLGTLMAQGVRIFEVDYGQWEWRSVAELSQ